MHKTTLSCYVTKYLSALILFVSTNTTLCYTITPLNQILQQYPEIQYVPCLGNVHFNIAPFPPAPLFPHEGYFKECFILKIPNGKVQSQFGFVLIEDQFIKEMIWADQPHLLSNIVPINEESIHKVPGKVAVLAQYVYNSYCHWIGEVLGRLALLEMHGIEYDWLYIDAYSNYMKETLELWGVDTKKIIAPRSLDYCIQADELIVPSMVINMNIGFKNHIGLLIHPTLAEYVRNKLLQAAQKHVPSIPLSKKVFASRSDAPVRKIKNEDEIFELFKQHGFERYKLSTLSMVDQILLFNNADIVVSEHGAGLTNILFCNQGTKVIEIFQLLVDSAFWFISENFGLKYTAVQTSNFIDTYKYNWQRNIHHYMTAFQSCAEVPLEPIKKVIEQL